MQTSIESMKSIKTRSRAATALLYIKQNTKETVKERFRLPAFPLLHFHLITVESVESRRSGRENSERNLEGNTQMLTPRILQSVIVGITTVDTTTIDTTAFRRVTYKVQPNST